MKTITQATAGQIKQINRFASDAVEKVLTEFGLDNPGAQRVIEHGDEFAEAIHTVTITSLKYLSVSDKFGDEEVESSYGYLSGYKPKDILEQLKILRQLFPDIWDIGCADWGRGKQPVPMGAEGWFAIPRWQTLGATYQEALERVLSKKTRTDGLRGLVFDGFSQRLRQTTRTAKFFQALGDEQKGQDILIVPAQFGLLHRGHSVRRAREVMRSNEFGLDMFTVSIMLLTHPERLAHYDDLYVDCAGDEFDYTSSDGFFDNAPYFDFDCVVGFDTHYFGDARDYCGSASGFLPA